jgi:pyroglutamyl-peptidase
MTILFAGYSSFPGAPDNPAEHLIQALAAPNSAAAGADPAVIVLPVEWDRSWPVLEAAIQAAGARTVLLFGLHRLAERLRIETLARNRRELGRMDAAGRFPSGPAVMDGPETLRLALPWTRVAQTLRKAGVSFEWSTNAGSYLCNDTLYRLAYGAERLGVRRYGFFHVPLTDEIVASSEPEAMPEVFCSLAAADLERAARQLIAALSEDDGLV